MQESVVTWIEAGDRTKYKIMYFYGFSIIAASFFFNSPQEIFDGLISIISSQSILLSDYMAIGNIGSALFNAGLLFVLYVFIAGKSQALMNGPLIASLFTVAGFALFGKNIYNSWSIVLGVYLHSVIQKDHFAKYIIIAFFGTTLAPAVSVLTLSAGLPLFWGIVLGNIAGIIIGLILPPLASSYVSFQEGFNLYNTGFTAGVVGMIFMSLFRAYGIENKPLAILYQESDLGLTIFLLLLFSSMIALFFIYSDRSLRLYKNILSSSGRLVSDFVSMEGFAFTIFNMGVLGFLTVLYVLLVGGQFNGPVIGGIFTVVGFGSFGKHPKNVIPIMIGVTLATFVSKGDLSSTGAVITALFGTAIAPIAGHYGLLAGILAGFLHRFLVSNVSYLHGGMSLYNNGFSAGFVAAFLVPIFQSYRKEESYEE